MSSPLRVAWFLDSFQIIGMEVNAVRSARTAGGSRAGCDR
jgi:hypothetical protein